jgi:RecB family exonuclease
VLSYAAFDEQGTARTPSPYLEEAVAHLAPVARREVRLSELFAGPADAVAERDLVAIVADGLPRGDPVAAALYARAAVSRDLLARPRRLALARARPVRAVPADPAARLSPTSINDFAKCPYLQMMRVLKARRSREQALDPLTRGSIVHAALERLAQEPDAGGDAACADAVFDEVFAEHTAGLRVGLDAEGDARMLRMMVRRAAARLRESPVDVVEEMFELPLGDVTLNGRIDRIDAYPGGRLVRDYKTGANVDLQSVQLDAYLLAVPDARGAVFERLAKGDTLGFVAPSLRAMVPGKGVEEISPAALEERRVAARARIAEVAAAVRAGALAVRPRDPESCTRTKCDGFDLCRVARGRWLVRRAREAKGRGEA